MNRSNSLTLLGGPRKPVAAPVRRFAPKAGGGGDPVAAGAGPAAEKVAAPNKDGNKGNSTGSSQSKPSVAVIPVPGEGSGFNRQEFSFIDISKNIIDRFPLDDLGFATARNSQPPHSHIESVSSGTGTVVSVARPGKATVSFEDKAAQAAPQRPPAAIVSTAVAAVAREKNSGQSHAENNGSKNQRKSSVISQKRFIAKADTTTIAAAAIAGWRGADATAAATAAKETGRKAKSGRSADANEDDDFNLFPIMNIPSPVKQRRVKRAKRDHSTSSKIAEAVLPETFGWDTPYTVHTVYLKKTETVN